MIVRQIGENSSFLRARICEGLECLGIHIDEELNDVRGEEAKLNKDLTSADIYVVPTNEELMIARDTLELV